MRTKNILFGLSLDCVLAIILCLFVSVSGCSGTKARVMNRGEHNMVGSNKAGSEVYNPMVHSTVDKLISQVALDRVRLAGYNPAAPPIPQKINVYFASIENRSMEELGDFKEHLRASINEKLTKSDQINIVSERAVDAILRSLNMRADDLFAEHNKDNFISAMGKSGTPIEYVLFAEITSGTTESNRDMQREYKLTLRLVDTKTWKEIVESSNIRKEYNNSVKGKFFNWFKK
ncbi:MAG: penicillin-binding protein activator LpoB [Planctomycetaceae bacterium]|jgi:hypothetical protein|nr:penicillin-binding protein activator LpoB [Planctomycetaceae bacterium]